MPPPSQTVKRAIKEAVNSGRFTSQRAILQEIRSQGLRISNQSGRSLIRQNRLEIQRAQETIDDIIESGLDRIATRSGRHIRGDRFDIFLYRESDIANLPRDDVERVLRQTIRDREVFTIRRGHGDRLSTFTHVNVSYRASATVAIYIQGRLYSRDTKSIDGQFTTTVEGFTEELLADKVRQQAGGQITDMFGRDTGLGEGSVIDGLDIVVESLDVDIGSIQGRGGRR